MAEMVSVKDLVKRYRKANKNAVDGVTFSVETGEFFSLLGPNGAGKTTTISILTTTLSKTSGQVKIAGYDLDKQSSLVRQNVGIIFQNPSLDLNLTAEENIRFHTFLYGLYPFVPLYSLMPDAYKHQVRALAEVLGIEKEIFKPIKTFSGGMKRKLEIIRSLIHKPKVLFLDEPTSGLDPLSRKNLWEYLDDVRVKEQITIFLTTHYLEEAEGADHVCIINQGKVLSYGTPTHIKQSLIEDYLEVDTRDKAGLIKELTKLKYDFDQQQLFKIQLKRKTVQEVISSIKTPLTLVKTHTPTIEEAYLEIISRETASADLGIIGQANQTEP